MREHPGRRAGFNSAAPSQARRRECGASPHISRTMSWLQFGRALSGAETRHMDTPPQMTAAASIRPRPLRRGDPPGRGASSTGRARFNSAAPSQARRPASPVTGILQVVGASIRPRPLRRGDTTAGSWPSLTRTGFNSAAPSQARRPRGRHPQLLRPAEASIRPRPLRRGDSRRTPASSTPWSLQFGRALSGAETALAAGIKAADDRLLQFGRALSGAETNQPSWGKTDEGASIRPRPLRRGDGKGAGCSAASSPSFNSAAPSQARRLDDRLGRGFRHPAASIRPRPLRRGDPQTHRWFNGPTRASIRPRPLRRGDVAEAVSGLITRLASIRPRPLRRGDATVWEVRSTGSDALQFGRALSGAETGWNPKVLNRGRRLQFGRALSGAETSSAVWAVVTSPELQFGRALSGAETAGNRPRTGRSSSCFNSAAPSQARRPRPGTIPGAAQPALQFGRALSGAETDRPPAGRRGPGAASIRPRPLRRGDTRQRAFRSLSFMALQFGRALSGAETKTRG